MDGFAGAGEGGASAQGPSTGTTYKYGSKPGEGTNRESLGGRKKKGKSLPTMPQSEQSLPGIERSRPARKRAQVVSGSTVPTDGAR